MPGPLVLDPSQQSVLALPLAQSAVVLGAPGTGKTTTLIEFVADRVLGQHVDVDSVVVLTSERQAATRLRDLLSVRLGVPSFGPLARTVTSLAFEDLRLHPVPDAPAAARLLTGGEQDELLAELLRGHELDGTGPDWPAQLPAEVRALTGFRTELRELFSRVFEAGLAPQGLRELGREHGRPEWVAAAEFLAEYLDVVEATRPGAKTSSELLREAAFALRRSPLAPRHALLVLDDVQDFTRGGHTLLAEYAARGATIVAFGDPDAATTTFRGARPDVVTRLGEQLGVSPFPVLVLETAHRQSAGLREVTRSVTARIGAARAGQQRKAVVRPGAAQLGAEAGAGPGAEAGSAPGLAPLPEIVQVLEGSTAEQYATIGRLLREQHVTHGRPWNRMAVVVRSGAQAPAVARALAIAEVPPSGLTGSRALKDDYAAGQLLTAAAVVLGVQPLDGPTISELLLGPLGGLDVISLRRLRLALRHEELAGGGTRSADELLVEVMGEPHSLESIDSRSAHRTRRLAESLDAARVLAEQGKAVDELLWSLWEASGLQEQWVRASSQAGIVAEEANRNLDGIVQLFTSAKIFVERNPGKPAADYILEVRGSGVAQDTLAPQSTAESVLVTTPSGIAGREFDVVVVAALQEGTWPNLRLRGGLLHPQELTDAVDGVPSDGDTRKVVLDDELRMFAVAVSRAREQLVVAATRNEDELPSAFLRLSPGEEWKGARHPLTLRGVAGELRRIAVNEPERREQAAVALARLARAGVGGADPREWYGVLPWSTDAPLVDLDGDAEATVPVSPSRITSFEESPLGWFLDVMSGTSGGAATGVGTILHKIMEDAGATVPAVSEIEALIDARWAELGYEPGWEEKRERGRVSAMAQGLHDYLAAFSAARGELLSAEGKFQLKIQRVVISGQVDRIERDSSGKVSIVDLKTGRQYPSGKEVPEHAQLSAYQLAYHSGALAGALEAAGVTDASNEDLGGAKLVYIAPEATTTKRSYREVEQPRLDDDGFAAFWDRLDAAAEGMAGREFFGIRSTEQSGRTTYYSYRIHLVPEVSA